MLSSKVRLYVTASNLRFRASKVLSSNDSRIKLVRNIVVPSYSYSSLTLTSYPKLRSLYNGTSSCNNCQCQGQGQWKTVRNYSTPTQNASSSSPPSEEEESEESKKNEQKIRMYKKLFSTLLFTTTLIGVGFARKRKQHQLEENFQGCVRLPVDEAFRGSHREFFLCGQDSRNDKPGCVLPAQIVKDGTLRAIRSFKVEPSDVVVASFPKTGTTWVQEIVYLIENDLNLTKASEKVLEDRFPYLEYPYPGLASVAKQSAPRLIKTHLPLDFLPEDVLTAKVIYIARNPKDTVVSYYHFARMLAFSSYSGTFEEFLQKFEENQLPYCPFFGHVESYKKEEENRNLLIVTYEELTRDPIEVIKKIANFLEKPLSESEIQLLVEHTSFKEMAKNPSVNYSHWDGLGIRNDQEAHFMRKGKVGDWRNYFNETNNKEFDAWIKNNNKMSVNFEYDV